VRAVNDGLIVAIAEEARRPFDRDALFAEARGRQGIGDGGLSDVDVGKLGGVGGGEDLIEPLDVLLPALEDEAELSLLGRWMMRRMVLRLLEVRIQLADLLRTDPAVRDEPIERPVFVTGALLVGIADDGSVHGLGDDYSALRKAGSDDRDLSNGT